MNLRNVSVALFAATTAKAVVNETNIGDGARRGKGNMVRAKFTVTSKEETLYSSQPPTKLVTVKMSPVSCTSRKNPQTGQWETVQNENSQFWSASPSGSLMLGCINLAAADRFEIGKEYYLDFTPAPVEQQAA